MNGILFLHNLAGDALEHAQATMAQQNERIIELELRLREMGVECVRALMREAAEYEAQFPGAESPAVLSLAAQVVQDSVNRFGVVPLLDEVPALRRDDDVDNGRDPADR